MTAESQKATGGATDGADATPGGPAGAPRSRKKAAEKAGSPKTVVGKVTSDKMRKTRTVQVTRMEKDRRYGKYVRRRSSYYAHDEAEASHEGDTVLIEETRPLSRLKRWRLVKIVTEGSGRERLSHEVEESLAAQGAALERGEVQGAPVEGGAPA